jgi:hypothetical protein
MRQKLNLIMGLITFLAVIFGCTQTKKEPSWTKAKVLAEKLDHPSAITTDDKNIYYVTGGTMASLHEGTSGVWKMPLAGGPPVQLFKGFQKDEKTVIVPDTYVLATDEKYLYFSAGYIYRVPKEGGDAGQITPGTPTEMVLDEENIYWHNYVGEGMSPVPINMVSKKGGEPVRLTDNVTVTGFEIDKDFFYFSTPDSVFRLSKKDKSQTKIFSVEKGQVRGIIADNDFIYVLHWQDPRTQIVKISKKDNAANPLGQPASINTTQSVRIDEANLYLLVEKSTFGDGLVKMSKTDGTMTDLDGGYLRSFTVTKDKIYITDIANIYELQK